MDIRVMLGLAVTSLLLLAITIDGTTNIRSIEELDLEYNSRRYGRKIYDSCYDTDSPDQKSRLDIGCRDLIFASYYVDSYGINGNYDYCSHWDDADFSARELCCACGGGQPRQIKI